MHTSFPSFHFRWKSSKLSLAVNSVSGFPSCLFEDPCFPAPTNAPVDEDVHPPWGWSNVSWVPSMPVTQCPKRDTHQITCIVPCRGNDKARHTCPAGKNGVATPPWAAQAEASVLMLIHTQVTPQCSHRGGGDLADPSGPGITQ